MKTERLHGRGLHWSIAFLLTAVATSAAAQQELFTNRERVGEDPAILSPAAVAAYRVDVNVAALAASDVVPLHLVLPDGRRYVMVPGGGQLLPRQPSDPCPDGGVLVDHLRARPLRTVSRW